jgi:hypothetical protein
MLNIKINKDGVFFEQNGEVVRIEDKTVDELTKKLVNYICARDNVNFKIYGNILAVEEDKK